MNISIDDLASEIARELENYNENITEGIKKSVDIVAKETDDEIKAHITFKEHTKKYVKAFKIKKTYENKYNIGKTWHVAGGEHRLTHLLEKGHATKNGGRTQAYPHIIFGEELAKRRMEELTREVIDSA